MQKGLLVAATAEEVEPILNYFRISFSKGQQLYQLTDSFDLLITGVGMVATAFALGTTLSTKKYDIALNIGIAGAFSSQLALGEVVFVEKDAFSELGAQDHNAFIHFSPFAPFETNERNEPVWLSATTERSWKTEVRRVSAITVNSVHGNQEAIEQVVDVFSPEIESMEGAAFYYCCLQANIPAAQFRAISNYVEPRDRAKWQIKTAVDNLNATVLKEIL